MASRIDLTGHTYGFLYVEGLSDVVDSQGMQMWKCRCECGKITYARTGDLRSEHKKSCGCGIARRKVFHEPKTDCRAYSEGECVGLIEMLCRTRGECPFYKSRLENSSQE